MNMVDCDNLFDERFKVSSITQRELENIKSSRTKDDDTKYKARKVSRLLDENHDKFDTVVYNENVADILKWLKLDPSIPDNMIVGSARWMKETGEDVVFVSDDICLKNIARALGLKVEGTLRSGQQFYKGYQMITGSTDQINIAMENMDYSTWHTNEYLIISNTDDGTTKEMRYDGSRFVALKLPPSRFIKGKNSQQRCALDMLMNPDINICCIIGGYGSGKTYLAMRMALYAVQEKGYQSKILGIREPIGEGQEVGFLPGEKDSKVGDFFAPLIDQLDGGERQFEALKLQGKLQADIPYYLKGRTYNYTCVVVDEAEDLSEKQIRLIGTRLGDESQIFFAGDYKQSLINQSVNNPLVKMCNKLKGEESFGCICLGEDVRSSTSRMFADLFEK